MTSSTFEADLTRRLNDLAEHAPLETAPPSLAPRPGSTHRLAWMVAAAVLLVASSAVVIVRLDHDPTTDKSVGTDTTTTTNGTPTSSVPVVPGWQSGAPWPLTDRVPGPAVWTGQEVLVLAGSAAPQDQPERASYDRLLSYSPTADAWRTLDNPPEPLVAPQVVWADDTLVTVDIDGTTRQWDRSEQAWTDLDPPPRWNPGVGLIDFSRGERIVWNGQEVLMPLDGIALDPTSGTWTEFPAAPGFPISPNLSRVSGVALYGDRLAVLGANRANESAFFETRLVTYDTATQTWGDLTPPFPNSAVADIEGTPGGELLISALDADLALARATPPDPAWDIRTTAPTGQVNCVPHITSVKTAVVTIDLCNQIAELRDGTWTFTTNPAHDDFLDLPEVLDINGRLLAITTGPTWLR